jgi:Zn-dependent protease with chaperone function
MNEFLRLLESALISALLITVALGAVSALLQPALARSVRSAGAGTRAWIALVLLCGPAVCGVLYALALVMASRLVDSSALAHAACSSHHQSWLHACLWHPIERGAAPWPGLLVALLLLVGASLLVRVWCRRSLARRSLTALLRLAEKRRGLRVLAAETPIALACELGEGEVLVSSLLVERLPADQLQVVIAHERAHLRHRDALAGFIAWLASALIWPRARRRLLDALRLAQEQRSDEAAARSVGSRLLVAETLLAVEQLRAGRAPAVESGFALAFAHGFLRERVLALLAPVRSEWIGLAGLLFVLQGLVALASTGWVHGLSEQLITVLSGAGR